MKQENQLRKVHNTAMLCEFERTDPTGNTPKAAIIIGLTSEGQIHLTSDQHLEREALIHTLRIVSHALASHSANLRETFIDVTVDQEGEQPS